MMSAPFCARTLPVIRQLRRGALWPRPGAFRSASALILQPTPRSLYAILRRMKYIVPGLGPTETEVMEALWARGPLTVREVRAIIQANRPVAYATILTVSGHMEEKGLITRHST